MRQESLHFNCHSGLDPESSPVLDTGERREPDIYETRFPFTQETLDSCWSLPRI
jgi:hypothetical protein